jgi:cob(I)alamin adenosyltransferase
MVRLNKIYTRTGDDGTTALGTGARIAKDAPRVVAMGSVDETNARIGLARLETGGPAERALDNALARIQNDLFDIGADLCMPDDGKTAPDAVLRLESSQVVWLESEIDRLNENLKPLKSFVLPGGTPLAAALHAARTVARRAERDLVALNSAKQAPVSDPVLAYLNRLSDFLFVAARHANDDGNRDVLWQPGKNR